MEETNDCLSIARVFQKNEDMSKRVEALCKGVVIAMDPRISVIKEGN